MSNDMTHEIIIATNDPYEFCNKPHNRTPANEHSANQHCIQFRATFGVSFAVIFLRIYVTDAIIISVYKFSGHNLRENFIQPQDGAIMFPALGLNWTLRAGK